MYFQIFDICLIHLGCEIAYIDVKVQSRHFPEPWTPTKATSQYTNQKGMQNMQQN